MTPMFNAIKGTTGYTVEISVESEKTLYTSYKTFIGDSRRDTRVVNGREYHFGGSVYIDRIFDSLHALWIDNEKLFKAVADGGRAAYWKIKGLFALIDIR